MKMMKMKIDYVENTFLFHIIINLYLYNFNLTNFFLNIKSFDKLLFFYLNFIFPKYTINLLIPIYK